MIRRTERLEGDIWCGKERINNEQKGVSMVEEKYGLLDVLS